MRTHRALLIAVIAGLTIGSAEPAAAQTTPLKWATKDGATAINFGIFSQMLAQRDTADGVTPATDLCFRRIRLMAGAKVNNKLRFFIESDTPFLGEHLSTWATPPTILQDLVVTYEAVHALQFDVGLLLVPNSYNSTQSAASLAAIGYGPYSFQASTPTHSRTGRDQGVQARGYFVKDRFEYRLGVFRGASKHVDSEPLRYAARVVWSPYSGQTGFFYAGTFLGQRQVVSIGASYDHEGSYSSKGVDFFGEWVLLNGGSLTLQGDYVRYDGRQTFLALPAQDTWLGEAAYNFPGTQLAVFGQVARQDIVDPSKADAASFQSGVVYYIRAFTMNIKAGVGRTIKDHAASHTQVLVQAQLFIF